MSLVDDSTISSSSFIFIFACVFSADPAGAEFTFSSPINLGPVINSRFVEAGAVSMETDGAISISKMMIG